MRRSTYDHIKNNISSLQVDYEKGIILNRRSHNVSGYLKIKLKQKMIKVHQIICFLKYGEKCIGLVVNHIDGNKVNNRPDNLEIITQSENSLHAFRLGLRKPFCPSGALNKNNKLTDEKVREIKHLLSQGIKIKDIAAEYDIDRSIISRIKSGERWKHVI